jgi:3-deoxy-7-phosphoheptulonate synthase
MTDSSVENLNVETFEPLVTPDQLKREIPLSGALRDTVMQARETLRSILDGQDHRVFAVVGPCSIHDPVAAMDYAHKLVALARELEDTVYIVMRVYFEKPRTTTGWKGLVNDPHMNDSFRIQEGLQIARRLLLDIGALGLPAATEALDPISPQYLQDLIAWSAIGARTTESQTHRELASGLSCPVGFKNGTDGGLTVAVNALKSALSPHRFLGIDDGGKVTVVHTRGNRHAHVVLRGGSQGPNYDSVHIALAERELQKAGVPGGIVVDCSHANSNKDPSLQPLVLDNVTNQILEGNRSIVGVMLESNLEAGNQPIPADLATLRYGVSVTDGCLDWDTTALALRPMRDKLRGQLPKRLARA